MSGMPATVIAALDSSPAALRAAQLLAGHRGASGSLAVLALNVQSRPLTLWPGPEIDPGAMESALLEEGARQLQGARAIFARTGVALETAVRLGVPAEAISDEALRRRAAALFLGTRGEGMLRGFALGSVALRVAHRAQVPVVLVQSEALLPRAFGEAMRVLVPLDGSAHATRAVRELVACRDWLGTPAIDLVHVRPPAGAWETLLPSQQPLLDQWGTLEAEQATREARAALYVAGLGFAMHEARGEPAEEIVRLAGRLGSEMILMGTRGLGAVHHALVGSVALKVALASPVAVMLTP